MPRLSNWSNQIMEWARPIRTCGAVWLRPTPLSRPLIGCLPLSSAEIIGSFTSFILLHPPPVMDQSVRHQQCILHVRKRDDWIEMIIPSTGKLHFTPAFSRARPLWMPALPLETSKERWVWWEWTRSEYETTVESSSCSCLVSCSHFKLCKSG